MHYWKIFLLLSCLCTATIAEDWPSLRGPHGNGFSQETGILKSWSEKGPKEIWRKPLGPGFSGVVVVNNKLYTLMGDTSYEYCISLDAQTGKFLWLKRIGYLYGDSIGAGPRSTPTVDGENIYVSNTHGELWCLDANTGEKRWHHNFLKKFGLRKLGWGVCGSPLIYKNLVIHHFGSDSGVIVALDKITGELVWQIEERCSYSTPSIAKIHGEEQALFFTGNSAIGINPNDGTKYWEYPWKNNINAATPICHQNKVFISAAYGSGAAVFEVSKQENNYSVEEIWKNSRMQNHYSTSLLWEDCIYGFHNEILKCIDFKDSRKRWTKRGFGKGFLVGIDGHFIVLAQDGRLALVKLTPEDYVEVSVAYPFAPTTCYTAPSISNGKIFIRDIRNELVCLDLTK